MPGSSQGRCFPRPGNSVAEAGTETGSNTGGCGRFSQFDSACNLQPLRSHSDVPSLTWEEEIPGPDLAGLDCRPCFR